MKIGLDTCSCLSRQGASALDSSGRRLGSPAGGRDHKEVPDSVRSKVEEGRKGAGRLSFASQTPDFFYRWDRAWRAESKRLSSSKCLGLCFLICKMEALLLCGGGMKIIHSMSKASVIPSIIACLQRAQPCLEWRVEGGVGGVLRKWAQLSRRNRRDRISVT